MTEAGKQWGFDGSNRWSHEGFLEAALTIRKDIEDHQVLNDLYDSDNLRGANGGRRNYVSGYNITCSCSNISFLAKNVLPLSIDSSRSFFRCRSRDSSGMAVEI